MEPYLGEIKMFAGFYAPINCAFCDGQYLLINEYSELYSLIGTTYGGDGVTTFALPDLRGRVPIHQGHGPDLTNRLLGQKLGTETVTLSQEEMPCHNHSLMASQNEATQSDPRNNVIAKTPANFYENNTSNLKNLNSKSVSSEGKNMPHYNMAPSLGIHFIICIRGYYPQRP